MITSNRIIADVLGGLFLGVAAGFIANEWWHSGELRIVLIIVVIGLVGWHVLGIYKASVNFNAASSGEGKSIWLMDIAGTITTCAGFGLTVAFLILLA